MRKQSRYAAKGKPMPYSDLYKSWFAAITSGRTEEANDLSRKHQIRFGNYRPSRQKQFDAAMMEGTAHA